MPGQWHQSYSLHTFERNAKPKAELPASRYKVNVHLKLHQQWPHLPSWTLAAALQVAPGLSWALGARPASSPPPSSWSWGWSGWSRLQRLLLQLLLPMSAVIARQTHHSPPYKNYVIISLGWLPKESFLNLLTNLQLIAHLKSIWNADLVTSNLAARFSAVTPMGVPVSMSVSEVHIMSSSLGSAPSRVPNLRRCQWVSQKCQTSFQLTPDVPDSVGAGWHTVSASGEHNLILLLFRAASSIGIVCWRHKEFCIQYCPSNILCSWKSSTWASPTRISWTPFTMLWNPEPHRRLTVIWYDFHFFHEIISNKSTYQWEQVLARAGHTWVPRAWTSRERLGQMQIAHSQCTPSWYARGRGRTPW